MNKRWHLKSFFAEKETALQTELKIHPLLCRLLVQREINNYEDAFHYFRPALNDLHDPWKMKDMEKAVARIEQAFQSSEKILVYGDYDVDGTTAVATVYSFIQSIYPDVDYYVPHRYREGYGISIAGIDYAYDNNCTLVIALDCGIKSIAHIAYAKEKGIDFIVCDHHLPDDELPAAVAILNPLQDGCEYPYKELSGCGIGFKLIAALAEKKNIAPENVFQYLDLVATSIAADIVPINGENRVLAYYGLKKANDNPQPGIAALKQLSGLKKQMHIGDLVFIIAPRINAAGRMDDARKAIKLFIEKDFEKALEYAGSLHNDNTERKEVDSAITQEAIAMIKNDALLMNRKTTVLYQPHWHKGVVGIVASRLIETFYRPTIILTGSNDKVGGSARSVNGFNLYEAIDQCKDLLENYGGHFYAAGLTLKKENLSLFCEKFETIVAQTIDPNLLTPEINIDTEIQLQDITSTFYKIINQFEPYGPCNLRPVFIAKNITDIGYSKIVKQDHIRFEVQQNNNGSSKNVVTKISGIGFNLAHKFDIIQNQKPFDICFTIDENEWNGISNLQLKVIDIRPAGAQ